jgi:hypothetical protein
MRLQERLQKRLEKRLHERLEKRYGGVWCAATWRLPCPQSLSKVLGRGVWRVVSGAQGFQKSVQMNPLCLSDRECTLEIVLRRRTFHESDMKKCGYFACAHPLACVRS